MDVGLVVGNIGYLAALFAGLSALALAVQLGEPPVTDRDGKKKAQQRKSRNGSPEMNEGDQAATFNAEGKMVANELTNNPEVSLSDLRKTFVDGFSGPRSKYDIALTILHEYQDESGTTNGGTTMAAEAYLNATHTIISSEQSEPLKQLIASNKKTRSEDAGSDDKNSKPQPAKTAKSDAKSQTGAPAAKPHAAKAAAPEAKPQAAKPAASDTKKPKADPMPRRTTAPKPMSRRRKTDGDEQ